MSLEFCSFGDRQSAIEALADRIADELGRAVAARGVSLLLAGGGATPIPLYQRLSAMPAPWRHTIVLPTDARWLSEDQEGSNERMIRAALLTNAAAAAHFLPLYGPESTAEQALPRLRRMIAGLPRPDLALLGMGEDGHTASLFKDAEGVGRAVDPAAPETIMALETPTGPVTPHRLTLTVPEILTARRIFILFFGEAKRMIFDQAMHPGPVRDLPIRAVIQQARVPVEVYWAS